MTPVSAPGVRVPDDRLDELDALIALYARLPRRKLSLPPQDIAALVADLRAARADNQRLRRLAENARNAGAAPDYDELAIRAALWILVDAVLEEV